MALEDTEDCLAWQTQMAAPWERRRLAGGNLPNKKGILADAFVLKRGVFNPS
jgi:hypothetical protein